MNDSEPATEAMDEDFPATGRLDENFALLRKLGSRRTGSVYEAEHLALAKRVAIKLIHADLTSAAYPRIRFAREVRAVALIDHPSVVDVYDFGIATGGTVYVVMELLRGDTVEGLLARAGALPVQTACSIVVQVLQALAAAHERDVVHGDLKPSNVFVTRPKADLFVAKVVDFGHAAALLEPKGTGQHVGKSLYVAPERAGDGVPDPRSDIYSAGGILDAMLAATGARIPQELSTTIATATAANPERRFQSALAFARELTPYVMTSPHPPVRSADANLLRAASKVPEIRFMSGPPKRTLSRDFPAVNMPKQSDSARARALPDSTLKSPVFPKAPIAPRIQVYAPDTERWSGMPESEGAVGSVEVIEKDDSVPTEPRALSSPQSTDPDLAGTDPPTSKETAELNRAGKDTLLARLRAFSQSRPKS